MECDIRNYYKYFVFIFFSVTCDHAASYIYFAKSIRDPNILACKCARESIFTSYKTCLNPCVDPVAFGEHTPNTWVEWHRLAKYKYDFMLNTK
jgi:hypothetical protein